MTDWSSQLQHKDGKGKPRRVYAGRLKAGKHRNGFLVQKSNESKVDEVVVEAETKRPKTSKNALSE